MEDKGRRSRGGRGESTEGRVKGRGDGWDDEGRRRREGGQTTEGRVMGRGDG